MAKRKIESIKRWGVWGWPAGLVGLAFDSKGKAQDLVDNWQRHNDMPDLRPTPIRIIRSPLRRCHRGGAFTRRTRSIGADMAELDQLPALLATLKRRPPGATEGPHCREERCASCGNQATAKVAGRPPVLPGGSRGHPPTWYMCEHHRLEWEWASKQPAIIAALEELERYRDVIHVPAIAADLADPVREEG